VDESIKTTNRKQAGEIYVTKTALSESLEILDLGVL